VQTSFITASVHWGLGRHTTFLSGDEITTSLKFITLCQGWGIASTSFGRISFCLYLFQFVGSSQIRRSLIFFFVGTQAFVNALTIIQIYVQCGSHVEALWNPNLGVKCWNPNIQRDLGFFQSGKSSNSSRIFVLLTRHKVGIPSPICS
jgi:hypothetical protein